MAACNKKPHRTGGVYIAVLGTSLIVALLGLSALMGQRIQNRMLSAAADIRQAQLNANTAVELGLLTMKQNANWRTTLPNGNWFTARGTSAGTCTLNVTDPVDSSLANSDDDPVVVLGIGYSGQAEQRVEVTVDPRKEPLSSLRSAIAVGDDITLNADALLTDGLITASDVNASSSLVYGEVEALTVVGSTYAGTTTQVTSDKRPAMPDWTTVFNYYRTNGTELPIGSLASSPPSNLARNPGVESPVVANDPNWTGTPPGLPTITAQVNRSNNWAHSGSYSLRVTNRTSWQAGAVQRIEHFVKPGQQYDVEAWAAPDAGGLIGSGSRAFHMTLHVKGTNDVNPLVTTSPSASATWLTVVLNLILTPAQITGRLTVPTWSGSLEYAFVKIADASSSGGTADIYVDDLLLREVSTGRYIYRKVLSPTVNTLYAGAPTNAQGIYWINCNGNRLTIERSRILGTLLLINPGANSGVAPGPINWSPAVAGYPALLVDADTATDANFSLRANNRALGEAENQLNYNPAGAPYDFANALCNPTDTAANDFYPSEIRGLIAIRNNLIFQNYSLVRGQVIVGNDIDNSSGALEVDYVPDSLLNTPPGFLAPYSHVRRPASTRKVVLP